MKCRPSVGVKLLVAILMMNSEMALAVENYVKMGVGLKTCGQFASDYKKMPDIDQFFIPWFQGYMSGLNYRQGDQARNMKAMSPEAQMTRIMQFCDSHPLLFFYQAVEEVYEQLPKIN